MKTKKILLLVVLTVAVVGIFAFFFIRPRNANHNLVLQELARPPQSPNPVAEFKHGDSSQSGIKSIVFSSDGEFLVAGGVLERFGIRLWDVSSEIRHIKSLKHQFDGTSYAVNAVAFSPNGKWLASASKHVKLWDITDAQSMKEITTFKHDGPVAAIDFSSDGQFLAAGGSSDKVRIWNVQKMQFITFLHDATVQAFDFSPDGQFLAAGDNDGNVVIWDTQVRQVIKTLRIETLKGDPKQVHAVKFSTNSNNPILASGGQSGIIRLWALPDWELQGTIQNTSTAVYGLAFSQNKKVLASTSRTGVELWSTANGAHIISLTGHIDEARTVDFSSNGPTLASGGASGILRIWNIAPYVTPQRFDARARVQLIYFVPRGRLPQPYIWQKLDRLIRDTQQFYADEMEYHGFGRKTFNFERDENGKAVVYRVDGKFTDDYYFEDTHDKVIEEIAKRFDAYSQNVWLIVVDISENKIGGAAARGGFISETGLREIQSAIVGYACIPASDLSLSFPTMTHELGHAFGLEHDFRKHHSLEGSYIMSYDRAPPYRLSKCAAEWLDKSRLFNQDQKFFNGHPTIEMFPSLTDRPNTTQFRFKVQDADGLHQVQLAVPTTKNDLVAIVKDHLVANPSKKREILESLDDNIKDSDLKRESQLQDPNFWEVYVEDEANRLASIGGAEWKWHSCQRLNGQKTATVEFELTVDLVKAVNLQIIDAHGNIAWQEFDLSEDSAKPLENP